MPTNTPSTSFITFYSFKGGVGRSMALINTAAMLAGRGFSVLVMDLDLEAPGLSYLASPISKAKSSAPRSGLITPGFVDLMLDAKEFGRQADLFALDADSIVRRYSRKYELPLVGKREASSGSLYIMPAGRLDEEYPNRFDSLNLRELYQSGLGEPLIRAFKRKLSESAFDYVLVDSRTGFSDEAGICTRDLADYLIILSGLNRQNIEGTSEFLGALRKSGVSSKFQIILSPVPNGEDRLMEEREKIALDSFQGAWGKKIELKLQIPYHPQLALTEEPHIFRRRRGYLFDAYSAIEKATLSALGHDATSVRSAIRRSLGLSEFGAVSDYLRLLIRLPYGRETLAHIAIELLNGTVIRFMPGEALSNNLITIASLVKMPDGRKTVQYIIDNIPIENSEDFVLSQYVKKLPEIDSALANRFYQRVVQRFPDDAGLLFGYATLLAEKLNKIVEAKSYYENALAVAPHNAEYSMKFAEFLIQNHSDFEDGKGKIFALAEKHFVKAVELNPEDPEHVDAYAEFLVREKKDVLSAKSLVERALMQIGDHPILLGRFALLLDNIGEKIEAEEFYKRAVDADPEQPDNLGNFALYMEQSGKPAPAVKAAYERAYAADPRHQHNLMNFATFLAEQPGEEIAAESYFKRSIAIDVENIEPRLAYARFLDEQGNIKAAQSQLKKALSINSHDIDANYDYALFLSMKLGRFNDALKYFSVAISNSEPDANLLCNYGHCLICVGRWSDAYKVFIDAIEILDEGEYGLVAELSMCLWLATKLQGIREEKWLASFKWAISHPFLRNMWTFSKMKAIAENNLTYGDADLFSKMVNALRQADKVPELSQNDEWNSCVAQAPI